MKLRQPAGLLVALAGLMILTSVLTPAVGAQTPPGQVVGKPDISIGTATVEFEPGTQALLQLDITNRARIDRAGPAQYEERVTTARGLTLTVESDDTPIRVTSGQVAVGNVPTGTVPVDPVSITIPENTTPGTYTLPVEYEYAYTRIVDYNVYGADYTDRSWSQTDSVTIRVLDEAQFEIVDFKADTQIGDTGDIAVTIQNTGTDPAESASVTVSSATDELVFGTRSQTASAFVGNWSVGENRTVTYEAAMADSATIREYVVNLAVEYTDTDGMDQRSRSLKAGVQPAPEQQFAISNSSGALRAGEESALKGQLVNTGPERVVDPVVTMTINNANIDINTPEYALPTLAPGESAPFEYSIDISETAEASVQQFDLTVKYQNQAGDTRRSDELRLSQPIDPERDRFVVALANDSTAIPAGTQRATHLRVTNNGDESLRNIEAKAFVSDPLDSIDDEAIIPVLAPGESATITIDLSAGDNALEKTYPVSLDFQYDMPDGDTELSRTYDIPIMVTKDEAQSTVPVSGIAIGIGVISVIISVLGWRRWRQ